ncbi:MAG: DUF4198 domain-containing protein [Acidobacteriota bacterium]
MPRLAAAVALVLCWSATAARAHDTWLLPLGADVALSQEALLDLSSGMEFPRLDTAIAPERVASAECRLAGARLPLARSGVPGALRLRTRPTTPGLATCGVGLLPRRLELRPAEVEEYLAEIGAPAEIRRIWRSGSGRWVEQYTKHAKSFVRVGGKSDGTWAEPLGLGLELVPESDPTTLAAGSRLEVRALRAGQPAAGLAIGVVRAGETKAQLVSTGADGRATFELARPGRYLVRATLLRPASEPGLDWVSDFTTLTLFVR